jgi:hypothetical protein
MRDNPDASTSPLKLAHDEYRTNTKAGTTAAEVNLKKSVVEYTKTVKTNHFLTHGTKKRYNLLLVHDSLKPIAEQALAGKTRPCPESELGVNDDAPRVHQGSCPVTAPAFANGVNGVKVVGKPPHGAHDENMSGSIVPVDCADGFTASPEGSNPLVFQRCEPVDDLTRYAWVAHGTCTKPAFSDMHIGKDCTLWGSVAMDVSGKMNSNSAGKMNLAQCKAACQNLGTCKHLEFGDKMKDGVSTGACYLYNGCAGWNWNYVGTWIVMDAIGK